MAKQDAKLLREQAQHCRDLARHALSEGVRQTLLDVAELYETRAKALEEAPGA